MSKPRIETYLWSFCGNNPRSWADNISHAEFTHNHYPHSITHQSPFYLIIGYEPHALLSVISDTAVPTMETCLKALFTARKEALAAHELACQVMAAHTGYSFSLFKLGDKVWLEARNLKHSIVNPKFAPKQEGPFTIMKVLSPIVYQPHLRKMWKIHSIFHASLLSPIVKTPSTVLTFHHHPLTLSMAKRSMKSRRFYITMEL